MLTFKKHIDPSIDKLEDMVVFNKVSPTTDVEKEEYPYLENVVNLLGDQVKVLLKRLRDLEEELEKQVLIIERESGDDKTAAVKVYNQILKRISEQVERINRELSIIKTPYFGKIVFEREKSGKLSASTIVSYIGKFSYFDKESNKTLITDWRAPIANLYYTNSGPTNNVNFVSPAGSQSGNLTQKRQFEITNARFSSIYDAKSGNVAADEFLLSQLQKRLGKKLSDIVATIQHQQNQIIRDELGKASILQGVAGSGKTTIVLHRLAYLLFAFDKNVNPEKALIIAPNKMFLDYISDVLPGLGVYGVESNTYIFWAKKVLGWDDSYIVSPDELKESKEFKGKSSFLKILKKFLDSYEQELLDNLPYSRKESVKQRYFELKEMHPHISLDERIRLSIERANLELQFNKGYVGAYFDESRREAPPTKDIDLYLKKALSPITVYKALFESKDAQIPYEVSKYTKSMFKKRKGLMQYAVEDLAPLLYILFWLKGTKDFQRDYIIADEAQDMSPMQILTLAMVSKNSNLMLAGDIAQSIIPPFYIDSWKELGEFITSEIDEFGINYYDLNKCYRTTIEIVEFANKLLKRRFEGRYELPEAVLRHGDNVEIIEIPEKISESTNPELKDISDRIEEHFKDGFVTVALLCKNELHATQVFERLSTVKGLSEKLINSDESDYTSGILVLPITKAKGLEFDCVYILDFNDENYKDNELDSRLLYVAMTRALHKLSLITNSKLADSVLLSHVK